jgi:hypothetical protein
VANETNSDLKRGEKDRGVDAMKNNYYLLPVLPDFTWCNVPKMGKYTKSQ